MLPVGTKGHRLLTAQPLGEVLIRSHQTITTHGEQDRPQGIDHFISPVRLGGDLGIERDQ